MSAPRVYAFEGVTPVVDPSAYVHPSAVLIGDVIVGPGCFIGGNAVLRGDFGRIVMERDSNVQDNCTVHSLPDFDCTMAVRAHVGHGAIVHAAYIGHDALVGMNAVVLDRAQVGEYAMLAAMSFVKLGGVVPPRVLWAGIPGRVVRELSDADIAGKGAGTDLYVELAQRCRGGIEQVDALASVDATRDATRTRWAF